VVGEADALDVVPVIGVEHDGVSRAVDLFGRASAVRVSLRPVPAYREAQSYTKPALLRLVEALV
jgi:hypothetical protein